MESVKNDDDDFDDDSIEGISENQSRNDVQPNQQTQLEREKVVIPELRTAPYDPRFPNANQTKHCYFMFIDYHRCTQKHGNHYEPCDYFKKVYKSMCPNAWVEKWNQQMQDGVFPFQFRQKEV